MSEYEGKQPYRNNHKGSDFHEGIINENAELLANEILYKKALRMISAKCGIPDAAEACKQILQVIEDCQNVVKSDE